MQGQEIIIISSDTESDMEEYKTNEKKRKKSNVEEDSSSDDSKNEKKGKKGKKSKKLKKRESSSESDSSNSSAPEDDEKEKNGKEEEEEEEEDSPSSDSEEESEGESDIKHKGSESSDPDSSSDSHEDAPKEKTEDGKQEAKKKKPQKRRWPSVAGKMANLATKYHFKEMHPVKREVMAFISDRDDDEEEVKGEEIPVEWVAEPPKKAKGYKMVTFEVQGETFTITRDKIMDAFDQGCMIKKKMDKELGMVIEQGKRKNSIEIIEKEVKPFYFHLALEWARTQSKYRFPDTFIYAAIKKSSYISTVALCNIQEFEMTVDDVVCKVTMNTDFIKRLYEFRMAMDYIGVGVLVDEADLILSSFTTTNFEADLTNLSGMTMGEYTDSAGTQSAVKLFKYGDLRWIVLRTNELVAKRKVSNMWFEEFKDWADKEYRNTVAYDIDGEFVHASVPTKSSVVWSLQLPDNLADIDRNVDNRCFLNDDQYEVFRMMDKRGLKSDGFWDKLKSALSTDGTPKFSTEEVQNIENYMKHAKIGPDNVLGIMSVIRDCSTKMMEPDIVVTLCTSGKSRHDILKVLTQALFMDMHGVFSLFPFNGRLSTHHALLLAISTFLGADTLKDVNFSAKSPIGHVTSWLINKIQFLPGPNPISYAQDWKASSKHVLKRDELCGTSCRLGVTIPRSSRLDKLSSITPDVWMSEWKKANDLVCAMEKCRWLLSEAEAAIETFYSAYHR